MNTPLDIRVLNELQRRKGEWRGIAEGSGISYSWISKFVNGHIPNPGHTTLSDLDRYLSGATAKAA